MDDKSRRDFLRSGWKLGGALLFGAAAYTGYEALRPLTTGRRRRHDHRRHDLELRQGHEHVRAGRPDVRRERERLPVRAVAEVPASRMPRAVLRELGSVRVPVPRLDLRPRRRVHHRPGTAGHGSLQGDARRRERRRRHGVLEPGPPRGAKHLPHATQGSRAASARPDVPRERPEPPPFEPEWLDRSLNRYLAGVSCSWCCCSSASSRTASASPGSGARRPARRPRATRRSAARLFTANCAQCHGKDATGGGSGADPELERSS